MISKKYHELILLPTFEERFKYLMCRGTIGDDTFGLERMLNQGFYKSSEWKRIRNFIISRDNGCDLGVPGMEILEPNPIFIHHMNPLTVEDITKGSGLLLDPENLICVSLPTHNAIHYGSLESLGLNYVERKPNDTCPWRNTYV